MDILKKVQADRKSKDIVEMTLDEYLKLAKKDPSVYDTPPQRMLKAIGEPTILDTSKNPKTSRLFLNRPVRIYKPFEEFYGLEEVFERVVDYFKHAAQGLEESKQILYLLGPVGGAKSSIAHALRKVFESVPFYTIKIGGRISPVNDSPLTLFDKDIHGDDLQKAYGIPRERLGIVASAWLQKRLDEVDGDLSQVTVVKRYPSISKQIANARTEPGDETNQDISSLVGKMNIRQLDKFDQNDPDAYLYSGALNLANQGILEFVEMFKAPIKMLHPLLCATQDRMYNPTEGMAALPFEGIILAHSNESEWSAFKADQTNEAFIDRVYIVKVPYVLRYSEEEKVYHKLLRNSELRNAPVAPKTLEFLSKFSVLSRLVRPGNSKIMSKLATYNGESLKDKDANAKPLLEYKKDAGINEGMSGLSTRFAYKVLSKTFNFDNTEVAANPIHLMQVLRNALKQEHFGEDRELELEDYLATLEREYIDYLSEEILKAYFSSSNQYGQNIFDRYVSYADAWLQETTYFDQDTGATLDHDELNAELKSLEIPAGINNAKDFRQDIVMFVQRHQVKHEGQNPRWDSYHKIKDVIEKRLMMNAEEILPVISTAVQKSDDDKEKHTSFVNQMKQLGYTEKQIQLVVDYHRRVHKS